MHASNPSRSLIVVEEVLTQLALDTHGALSTLASSCLQQFGGVEISNARVSESADIWQSYIVVARQMLRGNDARPAAWEALDRVRQTVDSLRIAFTKLVCISESPPAAAADLRNAFPILYRDLQIELNHVGDTLRLELAFPNQFSSLRRTSYERSAKSLEGELGKLAAREAATAL